MWFGIYFVTGCILGVVCKLGAIFKVAKKKGLTFKEVYNWNHRIGVYDWKVTMAIWSGVLCGMLVMGLTWPVEIILEGVDVRANEVEEDYDRSHIRGLDS